jgi:MFS family permease
MNNQSKPVAPPPIPLVGWALLFMLVMASVLFFIDRQTLAILKSTISVDFAMKNESYGRLIMAYLLPYTVGYLFSGQLIDRWGTRRCAALFLVGMSAATIGCGLARNFYELLLAQVVLGLSESGVVPSIMVMITKWFPAERRGFVVTMHQALQSIGPVLTAPLVAALTIKFGWRSSFLIPGILSVGLALVWFLSDRSGMPAAAVRCPHTGAPGFGSLKFVLTTPALRGVVLTRIITDPAWFFLIYWQAAFLQDRGGWTLAALGRWTWLPPAGAAFMNIFMGWWSDKHLRASGHAPTARRIALQRLAMLAPCFALAPFAVGSKPFVLVLLILCYVMANCWLTMVNVLVTEVAPPGTVATAFGAMSALGGLASILFNYAAGWLVDKLGYATMFVTCACLYPLGVMILHHYYGAGGPAKKSQSPVPGVTFLFALGSFLLVALSLSGAGVPVIPQTAIEAYPLPFLYTNSTVYSLRAGGEDIPVVSYVKEYDYAEFSMPDGATSLVVTALTETNIAAYGISPIRLGITGAIAGNQLTFSLTNHQYLIVKINGHKKLVIAADPMEADVPAPSGTGIFNITAAPYYADATGAHASTKAIQNAIHDASTHGGAHGGHGIVYVPAGVYTTGNLKLQSNVALYLAGGSVLRASLETSNYTRDYYKRSQKRFVTWFISTATNAVNVKIYGRGTVDGNGYCLAKMKNFGNNLLVPVGCTNFVSDGVIYRDSGAWAVTPARSANLLFANFKLFNHLNTGEDDGIDVCECQNVTVSNAVAIALDDAYSTKTWEKATDLTVNWPGEAQVNSDIIFENCLAWTYCYCYKIGQGVVQPQEGITFRNCVAYECAVALGIDHKWGTAPVRHVTFDNIDIERVSNSNADHRTWAAFFVDKDNPRGGGPIYGLIVKNIHVRDPGTSGGVLVGRGNSAMIDGVTLENILMPGGSAPATSLSEMDILCVRNATNVLVLSR